MKCWHITESGCVLLCAEFFLVSSSIISSHSKHNASPHNGDGLICIDELRIENKVAIELYIDIIILIVCTLNSLRIS